MLRDAARIGALLVLANLGLRSTPAQAVSFACENQWCQTDCNDTPSDILFACGGPCSSECYLSWECIPTGFPYLLDC